MRLDVPLRANWQKKTGNSKVGKKALSECFSGSGFMLRTGSPNALVYHSVKCADWSSWEHDLPRILGRCRRREPLGICAHTYVCTHEHTP